MREMLERALAALEAVLPYTDCDSSEGAHPAWRTMHELRAELKK